jgi:hypothetical protein
MERTNIIVSDITCMKEKFCVAGWDMDKLRMKRLLINGGYWDATDLASIGDSYSRIFVNNHTLEVSHDYPHGTEDVNINIHSVTIKKYSDPDKKLPRNSGHPFHQALWKFLTTMS